MALSGSSINAGFIGVTQQRADLVPGRQGHPADQFQLRNLHSTDVSLIQAGNDIISGQAVGAGSGMSRDPGAGRAALVRGTRHLCPDAAFYSVGNRAFDYTTNTPYSELRDQGPARTGRGDHGDGWVERQAAPYDAFVAAYLDPANVAAMPDYLKTTVGGQGAALSHRRRSRPARAAAPKHRGAPRAGVLHREMTGEKLCAARRLGPLQDACRN